MTKSVHGIVRGNRIERTEAIGLNEGESVDVRITSVYNSRAWGAGILASAGGLSEDLVWDGIMHEIHHNRKHG